MAGTEAATTLGIEWSLDDLLQELIVALVGYTGDIFVDSSEGSDPRYTYTNHSR